MRNSTFAANAAKSTPYITEMEGARDNPATAIEGYRDNPAAGIEGTVV